MKYGSDKRGDYGVWFWMVIAVIIAIAVYLLLPTIVSGGPCAL